MSEVWRHELRGRGAYTRRPRNVLWPLIAGARVYARRFDHAWTGSHDNGVQLRAHRREDAHGSLRLAYTQALLSVRHGHHVRTYAVGVDAPILANLPKRMRQCLNGTGYPMDTRWERALARWAHRHGLRGDRVFGPDDHRRWELRARGLWLGEGR